MPCLLIISLTLFIVSPLTLLQARLEEIRKKRKLAEETGTSGNRRKRVKIERVAPTLNFTPGEIVDAADDIRVVVPESKSKKPKIVIDLTL